MGKENYYQQGIYHLLMMKLIHPHLISVCSTCMGRTHGEGVALKTALVVVVDECSLVK
jgi:hypothetical protein